MATVAQEIMEEAKLHVKNHNLENCEKSQKMIRLGTVFIDSIQWLQRGSQLEKSYAGELSKKRPFKILKIETIFFKELVLNLELVFRLERN